jgi:hypothetical protein
MGQAVSLPPECVMVIRWVDKDGQMIGTTLSNFDRPETQQKRIRTALDLMKTRGMKTIEGRAVLEIVVSSMQWGASSGEFEKAFGAMIAPNLPRKLEFRITLQGAVEYEQWYKNYISSAVEALSKRRFDYEQTKKDWTLAFVIDEQRASRGGFYG